MTMAPTCLTPLALTLTATLIPLASPDSLTELNALLSLKDSLKDPEDALVSWDGTSVTPCLFKHVTCDAQQNVIGLFLSGQNLSGSLVPELGALSSLVQLIMDQNDLSGPIPDELGKLGALHTLILSYNGLSGSIPRTLGNLTSLTTLGLDNNQFSGRIPEEIGNIKGLKIAAFNNNKDLCWEFQPTAVFRGDYPMCPKRQ